MILPTKHLPLDRSAIGTAAVILRHLTGAPTVSELWDRATRDGVSTFDQLALGLNLLFVLGVIAESDGRLVSND